MSTISELLQLLIDGTYKIVDASVQTRPEVQSAMMPLCLEEMKLSVLEYVELPPKNYVVDTGLKLSAQLNDRLLSVPYKIQKDGTDFVVADLTKGISVFDENWSVKKMYNMRQAPYNNAISVGVNDTHYIVGTNQYTLYALNKITGDVDWEFGVYNRRGKCSEGKLGHVYSIDMLPNGNIILATYDGAGDLNHYNGTIEEFTPEGVWVKTHLQYNNTGVGAEGETYNPNTVKVYGNLVYIGLQNRIDVFSYDEAAQELTYETVIMPPNDNPYKNLDIKDFVIEGNVLYITAVTIKKVIGLDLTTREPLFAVGHYNYENVAGAVHEGNAMVSPYSICVRNDKIYVGDITNQQIIEIFRDNYMHPTYDIPSNSKVVYSHPAIVDGVVSTQVGVEPPNLHLVYTIST